MRKLTFYNAFIASFLILSLVFPRFVLASEGTGGTISYSGDYTIHKFTSDGSFVIDTDRYVDYLVVGGGGGGGMDDGGGGGGGRVIYQEAVFLTAGTYSVYVGLGGIGSPSQSIHATDGESSYFQQTAVGGGGGGGQSSGGSNGNNGASGGGAGNGGIGGTGYYGYDGGNSDNTSPYPGGGGGGAGAVGEYAYTNIGRGGNGGDGISNSITGTLKYYAGGGGGGVYNSAQYGLGGNGGGGNGGNSVVNAVDGSVNTGGGGGGGGPTAGGDGGSGIVIVRYLTEGEVLPPSDGFISPVGGLFFWTLIELFTLSCFLLVFWIIVRLIAWPLREFWQVIKNLMDNK